MGNVPVVVKVTHAGKKIEKPAFAIRRPDGQFVVDCNFITAMANQIGYHPRVVSVSIAERKVDEAA